MIDMSPCYDHECPLLWYEWRVTSKIKIPLSVFAKAQQHYVDTYGNGIILNGYFIPNKFITGMRIVNLFDISDKKHLTALKNYVNIDS